jgi:hypothetical protein
MLGEYSAAIGRDLFGKLLQSLADFECIRIRAGILRYPFSIVPKGEVRSRRNFKDIYL